MNAQTSPRPWWARAFAALLALCALALASAVAVARPLPPVQLPVPVHVGAYVNNILDIDFKGGTVKLDLTLWFRWKTEPGDERLAGYDPLESTEFMNGVFESDHITSRVRRDSTADGRHYVSGRYLVTVHHPWVIDEFPFDRHRIGVRVEDSRFDASVLRFVADTTNSKLGNELDVTGWIFSAFDIDEDVRQYDTTYGDETVRANDPGTSRYSRATVSFTMRRDGIGPAVKLLTTVCIATLIAFVAFAVKPSHVDPRFGLGIGAMFAVAASAFVVASTVPDSSVLTVADRVHLLAMACIFLSLVQSTFCLRWDCSGRDALYRRADAVSLVVFPAVFAAATWLILPHPIF